jgi:hypothetical protein
MNSNRLAIVLVLAVGLAIVVGGLYRQRRTAASPGDPHVHSVLIDKPSEKSVVATQRINSKSRIVKQLIAGELTFLEAGAWFRYLNDNPPDCRMDFRKRWPGASDGEKACRQVISFVQADWGYASPSEKAALVAKLEDELKTRLAESGVIELPW